MAERADRLYDLLPAIYRMRDAEQGEPLRALLQVIAEQLNIIEDDIAQLYENWFIETADDWAAPYIGELVGYTPLHDAGEPPAVEDAQAIRRQKILIPRRDVANTVRYRSRKGTLALLEELALDAAGWPARAVEFFEVLGRMQSLNFLHVHEGGTLNLRDGLGAARLDGPFNHGAHSVDVRHITSNASQGRYNLPNVGLFIWRLRAYPITSGYANLSGGREPYHVDRRAGRFTFSCLGNDTPLFTHPLTESDPAHIAGVMNVPALITRRELQAHLDHYYGPGKSFCLYRRTQRAATRRKDAETRVDPIPISQITVANLTDWFYRPDPGKVAVDPERGRIAFPVRETPDDLLVHYHYGFSADLGGGEYHRGVEDDPAVWKVQVRSGDRTHRTPINDALQKWETEKPLHGVIEIADSGVYSEQIAINFDPDTPGQTLEFRSADRCFPALRLLNMLVNQSDDLSINGGPGNRVTLSGLLISSRGVRVNGDLDCVTIDHCTLVPGWELDSECQPCCGQEPSLTIVDSPPVEDGGSPPAPTGTVDQPGKPTQNPQPAPGKPPASAADCQTPPEGPDLRTTRVTIQNTILGSIQVIRDAVLKEPLALSLTNCILDATDPEFDALSTPDGAVAHAALTIAASTVIGEVHTHVITLGENTIFYGLVQVARSQKGCLRFCYVTPGSHTPRRFNCQPDLAVADQPGEDQDYVALRVQPRFNGLRYGKPVYCQLANDCAVEIKQGAEDESEMGAFHDLYQPQREANLRARLAEFTPASTEAGLIFVS